MLDPELQIPEQAIKDLEALRSLEGEYTNISYRMGTNGERGLYHKRKSVISKIHKAKDAFNATHGPKFTAVKLAKWPIWFIRVNEEI